MNMSVSKRTVIVIKSNTFQQRNLENSYLETNIQKTITLAQAPDSLACPASQSQQASQPASQPESQPTSKLQASEPVASKPAAVKGGRRQGRSLKIRRTPEGGAGRDGIHGDFCRICIARQAPPLPPAPPKSLPKVINFQASISACFVSC